ncbi:MAG: hypothetical protein PHG23_02180 [Candidatus Pacebacteria bacterium]|nr:hypothetical protein [Candidatus Paceibacterota bacterium]
MENEERKCQCGMSLNEETECKCEPNVCMYCCTCSEECSCGCKEKGEEKSEKQEGDQPN